MYAMSLSLDGFDTLSAQPNSPNDVITSKSQIIMMVFSVRSVGKCKFNSLSRCSHPAQRPGHPTRNSELIINRPPIFTIYLRHVLIN